MEQVNTPGAEGAPVANSTSELQPGQAAPPADGGVVEPTQPAEVVPPSQTAEEELRARNRKEQRFSDLSRAKNEAEREAAYWRGIAEGKGLQNGAQPPQPATPQAAQPQGRPDPNDTSRYPLGQYDERFVEDLADWKYEQREAAKAKESEAKAREAEEQRAFEEGKRLYAEAVQAAEQAGLERGADLLGALGRDPNARAIVDAITATHVPHGVAEYLAIYPDELRSVASMTPMQRAARLGRIAEHVSRVTTAPKSPPPPPPAPAQPNNPALQATPVIGGRGAMPAKDPNNMTMEEFAAWRRESA